MDKKVERGIGLMVALGTGLVIMLVGLAVDLIPGNKYAGVMWMFFMPVALFFMLDDARRNKTGMLHMWCSMAAGMIWGWLSNTLGMMLKPMGEAPFALVVYFLLNFGVMVVHNVLLKDTVFNMVPCVFLSVAFSTASSMTMWWTGKMDPTTMMPIYISSMWNQLDLIIIFTLGCIMALLMDACCGMLIGMYLKKIQGAHQEEQV